MTKSGRTNPGSINAAKKYEVAVSTKNTSAAIDHPVYALNSSNILSNHFLTTIISKEKVILEDDKGEEK
jgi:hypothetical protein